MSAQIREYDIQDLTPGIAALTGTPDGMLCLLNDADPHLPKLLATALWRVLKSYEGYRQVRTEESERAFCDAAIELVGTVKGIACAIAIDTLESEAGFCTFKE